MVNGPIESSPVFINQKSLRELAVLLVKDAGLHEGLFDVSFEIQTVIGSFGLSPAESLPGALIGVKSVGILSAPRPTPNTVDASEVNPRSKAVVKRSKVSSAA